MRTARPFKASRPVLLATCAAVLFGCGANDRSPPPAASAAPSAALPGSARAAPTASPAAAIGEAEVKALVDAWVRTQNAGDLGAYSALYARRFEGVRRSGPRTVRMDRRGWLADRARMFEKKTTVTASDLKVAASGTLAQVAFTQQWESGTYKDVGPKALLVIREDGALRIAREEMIASKLDGAKPRAPLPLDRFAFVIHDGGPRVVLRAEAPADWGKGKPRLLANAEPYPTRLDVDPGKVPADLAAWKGKRLRLHGAAGPACEATVTGLAVIARVIPHFGQVAVWQGKGDPPEPPHAPDAIAADAFELAKSDVTSGLLLTAELGELQGDCAPALWAQPASSPEIKAAKVEESADAKLNERLLEALRKLPEYGRLQRESEGPAPWDARGKTRVLLLRHPTAPPLAFVRTQIYEGCSAFQGALSAFFEITGDRVRLASKAFEVPDLAPEGVADVDGDGAVEVILKEGVIHGGVALDRYDRLFVPFLDCGC